MTTSPSASAKKRVTLAERNTTLAETLDAVATDRERLSEALSNAVRMLRQEDIGWAMPAQGQAYRGLTLPQLQAWSDQIRVSLTGTDTKAPNPHMRNGLMLRHSFIWAGDIHYSDVPGGNNTPPGQGKANVQSILDSPSNKRMIFSGPARRKREHALYSDGLYLIIGENANKKNIRPVPLREITDTHRDELYEDEIVAYRWTRNEAERVGGTARRLGSLTGNRVEKSYWVFVDWFDGPKPSTIRYNGISEPVLKGYTAFDLHANRPDGQAFGSPDAISALHWARIIRDLIMNGVKMQDALAMFAFKATAPHGAAREGMALELGGANEAGSAAALSGELDIVPLNSAGKGYDFGSIGFIVATMAASLHVSGISLSANTALAGSSYGAAKTLDLPGRMAMQTRRAEHIEFDERILAWLGAKDATAYFDNYDDATDEYRSVQAAMLAWQTGTLSPQGFRDELEIVYGRKLAGAIPDGVIIPNNQKQIDAAAAAALKTATATTAAPDQGRSNGAGDANHASDLPPGGQD